MKRNYNLKKIVTFLTIFFFLFFKVLAGQNENVPSPSRCKAQDWQIGLPDRVICRSNVNVPLSEVTNFLNGARIYPDLISANQFCKQYTQDSSAYAIWASVHNYCNGCDQYLAQWVGSRWNITQVCAGTLNIQYLTCATQCVFCQSHYEKKCVNNSVYWFDACGQQEELYKNCNANELCENGECKLIVRPPTVVTKPVVNTY